MKSNFLSALLLVSSVASASSSTKLYVSYDGDIDATIAVLSTGVKDQFLIEFDGFDHEYNNHVYQYQRRPADASGEALVYEMMGIGQVNLRDEGKRALVVHPLDIVGFSKSVCVRDKAPV